MQASLAHAKNANTKKVNAKNNSEYIIHQGDVLDVSVWGDETLAKVIRVLPDGYISFPLVGHVKVSWSCEGCWFFIIRSSSAPCKKT